MKKFIMTMLSNNSGVSSKRVIAFIGFLFLSISMFITVFKKEATPSQSLVTAVETIIIVALGGSTVEKFSKQNSKINPEDE
jgi:hypothetical protein